MEDCLKCLVRLCIDINNELWCASRYCSNNSKEFYGKELQEKYFEFKNRLYDIKDKEIQRLVREIYF